MLDLADRIYPRTGETVVPGSRLARMSINVVVFASGCGAAALLFMRFGVWCFVVPPVLAIVSLILRIAEPPKAIA